MKKFYWTVDNETETLAGEADTVAEAVAALELKGYFLDDDGVELHERSDEEMVNAARAEANPPEPKTSLQHLAEANASMFAQLDALKNRCVLLENEAQADAIETLRWKKNFAGAGRLLGDIASLGVAWNTEQHARLGAAHVEPPFIEMMRNWLNPPAPEKEKPNGHRKPESESAPSGGTYATPSAAE